MAEAPINDFLDDDCLSEVFSYLVSIPDLINAQKVCTRWHRLCRGLWKDVNVLHCEFDGRSFISKRGCAGHRGTFVSDLEEILKYCGPFILEFAMMNVNPLTCGSVITTVSAHCKNLEDVYIQMPFSPSVFRIYTLLHKRINLKKLHVVNFAHDVEEDLILLQGENINLKSFSLSCVTGSLQITGEFFKYLPVDLEAITIEAYRDQNRIFSFSALKRFKNLRSFKCIFSHWYENLMEPKIIGEMESLVKLSLVKTFIMWSSFNYLVTLVNLKELNLSHNTNLMDENVINIVNNCKQIEILNLSGCDSITDNSIANINIALEKLKWFLIDDVNEITDEPIADLPSTLERLSCKRCDNVKVDGIIRLMRRTRNCNISIRLDHSADTDALIAGAEEIIEDGTHHILFRIGNRHTTISLTKNETALPSLLDIEHFEDIDEFIF